MQGDGLVSKINTRVGIGRQSRGKSLGEARLELPD